MDETGFFAGRKAKFIWVYAEYYAPDAGWRQELSQMVVHEVRKRGGEIYFYAVDEPGGKEKVDRVKRIVPLMHENFPDVKVTTAIGPGPLADKYYDACIFVAHEITDKVIEDAKIKPEAPK